MNTEYTVQQVLQSALGGPQMTDYRVSLLHSLIDIILKKLSCENEKVTVTGYESKCLQQLFPQLKISPLPFKTEKIQALDASMENLERLERRMKCVNDKLHKHLEMVKKYNRKSDIPDALYWMRYSPASDGICIGDDADNRLDCNLLKDSYFVKKLRQFTGDPLAEHVRGLGQRVQALHTDLLKFQARANEQYKDFLGIDLCIVELEILSEALADERETLTKTMARIQKLLDTKLNKQFLSALRMDLKWYQQDMETLVARIKRMQKEHESRKKNAAKRVTACLSCGGLRTCVQKRFHVAETQPSGKFIQGCAPPRFYDCTTTNLSDATLTQHVTMPNAGAETRSDENRVPYAAGMGGINLLVGTNGNIYRNG